MNYTIREMLPDEYPLLEEFLYQAVYQRDGNLAPRTIINEPALQIYIHNFGKYKDDYCLCAQSDNKIIGAVWVRNIKGYGNIDDTTPEFAISLFKEYRGYGIGTSLMNHMVEYLKKKGYQKASLAVQKDNYALNMYKAAGFEIIDENTEEYIMVHNLGLK